MRIKDFRRGRLQSATAPAQSCATWNYNQSVTGGLARWNVINSVPPIFAAMETCLFLEISTKFHMQTSMPGNIGMHKQAGCRKAQDTGRKQMQDAGAQGVFAHLFFFFTDTCLPNCLLAITGCAAGCKHDAGRNVANAVSLFTSSYLPNHYSW